MKNKILGILVVILLIATVFPKMEPTKGYENKEVISVANENCDGLFYQVSDDDCHVIEGVPYVGWKTGFDCELCCFAMMYLYLGINYTYDDLFYLSGAAYSHASGPRVNGPRMWPDDTPPFKPYIDPGAIACFWKQDIALMCELFGLNYTMKYNQSKKINDEDAWCEYWSKIKNYIKNDQPVWINIDGLAIPWWREHFPIAKELYEKYGLPSNAYHVILLVGFNETNGTVCYHDMVNSTFPAGYVGPPNQDSYYIWMNISDLKNGSVLGSQWYYWDDTPYITLVLENISKEPFEKEEALKLVHSRNIEKMKGNKYAYDSKYFLSYKKFGINALETLKKDLSPVKIIPRLILWRFTKKFIPSFSPFYHINKALRWIIKEKELTSNVLIKYANIYDNCSFLNFDGLLLQNETKKWQKFQLQWHKLRDSFINDSVVHNLIVSYSILKNMIKIVEDIIYIERTIIKQYSNERI